MPEHNKTAILDKETAAPKEPQLSLRLRQAQKISGSGVLDEELHGDATARADFRVRVLHLQKFPRVQWQKKQFRSLGKQLFEIKWKSRKREWRAIGYDDADGYFVVVKICTHKGQVYDPASCIEKSREIKSLAQSGKQKVIDYVL